jgi:hypothetical protein
MLFVFISIMILLDHSTRLIYLIRLISSSTDLTRWLDESLNDLMNRFINDSFSSWSSHHQVSIRWSSNIYLMNQIEIDMKHVKEVKNRLYKSLNSSHKKINSSSKFKHWRSHWYYVWCHEFRWIHNKK